MVRSLIALGTLALALVVSPSADGNSRASVHKLDRALQSAARGEVRIIVRTTQVADTRALIARLGGRTNRILAGGQAVAAVLPASALHDLAKSPATLGLSLDRPLRGTADGVSHAVGARWVTENLRFDGAGVGVAIVDSGVTAAHDDLAADQVVHFVDFVDGLSDPHDPYGHGTHVAGIIAGSGHDSSGARRGIAPRAHLVVLRTLDDRGEGHVSDAIAAIDYAIEQRQVFNIRVLNLSVAAGVYESYRTDPLTLAARRAVAAGIVVVTAAGNHGVNDDGKPQYGGITAPGNAPWVLTVGASDHHGTADPSDDTVARFSSLGPSAIDLVPKPDLVAPGVGIESLAEPGSTLFTSRPDARLWGTVPTETEPYLALSGTSMAAPVVAGTVALMLQANPTLSPQAVKAVLQRTAERKPGYSSMAQGAGFLDARAAVELAVRLARSPSALGRLGAVSRYPSPFVVDSVEPCGFGRPCAEDSRILVASVGGRPAPSLVKVPASGRYAVGITVRKGRVAE